MKVGKVGEGGVFVKETIRTRPFKVLSKFSISAG